MIAYYYKKQWWSHAKGLSKAKPVKRRDAFIPKYKPGWWVKFEDPLEDSGPMVGKLLYVADMNGEISYEVRVGTLYFSLHAPDILAVMVEA